MKFTREQAIKMALDAGLPLQFIDSLTEQNAERITRLCNLLADMVLEAAARQCDKECDNWDEERGLIAAAKAIRAMKDHQ